MTSEEILLSKKIAEYKDIIFIESHAQFPKRDYGMTVTWSNSMVRDESLSKFTELFGRVCYKSEDKITSDSSDRFIKSLINSGHESVLEHIILTAKFVGSRSMCYSDDTKVLTDSGWKLFTKLNKEDKVLTKDNDGNMIYENIDEIINQPFDGNLLQFKSSECDLLVTEDHNMWCFDHDKRSPKTRIWKFIKAKDMKNNRYKLDRGGKWSRGGLKEIRLPDDLRMRSCSIRERPNKKIEDLVKGRYINANLFLELTGIFITDGSLRIPKNRITRKAFISQTKERGRFRIRELLSELKIDYKEGKAGFDIKDRNVWRFWYNNFYAGDNYTKSFTIKIPRWIMELSKENLKSLMKGIVLGNGSTDGKSTFIYTSSPYFKDDIVEMALKLGFGSAIQEYNRDRTWPNGHFSKCKVSWRVNIEKQDTHLLDRRCAKIAESIPYKGNIVCAKLKKHHRLFVMRNGKSFWSGNSHQLVRHRIGVAISQESQRYCNYNKSNKLYAIIPPTIFDNEKLREFFFDDIQSDYDRYRWYILQGIPPEDAREKLPNCTKTEVVMTCNIRQWRHVFTERALNPKAQWQIRKIALEVLNEFVRVMPEFFSDLISKES